MLVLIITPGLFKNTFIIKVAPRGVIFYNQSQSQYIQLNQSSIVVEPVIISGVLSHAVMSLRHSVGNI